MRPNSILHHDITNASVFRFGTIRAFRLRTQSPSSTTLCPSGAPSMAAVAATTGAQRKGPVVRRAGAATGTGWTSPPLCSSSSGASSTWNWRARHAVRSHVVLTADDDATWISYKLEERNATTPRRYRRLRVGLPWRRSPCELWRRRETTPRRGTLIDSLPMLLYLRTNILFPSLYRARTLISNRLYLASVAFDRSQISYLWIFDDTIDWNMKTAMAGIIAAALLLTCSLCYMGYFFSHKPDTRAEGTVAKGRSLLSL